MIFMKQSWSLYNCRGLYTTVVVIIQPSRSFYNRLGIYTTIDLYTTVIVQELCESRGGRPGLSVLTSLLVSVDVKLY